PALALPGAEHRREWAGQVQRSDERVAGVGSALDDPGRRDDLEAREERSCSDTRAKRRRRGPLRVSKLDAPEGPVSEPYDRGERHDARGDTEHDLSVREPKPAKRDRTARGDCRCKLVRALPRRPPGSPDPDTVDRSSVEPEHGHAAHALGPARA